MAQRVFVCERRKTYFETVFADYAGFAVGVEELFIENELVELSEGPGGVYE